MVFQTFCKHFAVPAICPAGFFVIFVVAGLLAKAVFQLHKYWMCNRLREQARSHKELCVA